MRSLGLLPKVLAERSLYLRPLFDLNWLEQLGGVAKGLYRVRDGRAQEMIYVVEARAARRHPISPTG